MVQLGREQHPGTEIRRAVTVVGTSPNGVEATVSSSEYD
jgi:hypothetical protein